MLSGSRALPTQFLKAIRTRPWAYQSLWRISMLLQGTRLPSDISRVVVVLDQDVELSYDEFERAYGRYIEELVSLWVFGMLARTSSTDYPKLHVGP